MTHQTAELEQIRVTLAKLNAQTQQIIDEPVWRPVAFAGGIFIISGIVVALIGLLIKLCL